VPFVGGLDSIGGLNFLRYLDGRAYGAATGIAPGPCIRRHVCGRGTSSANFPVTLNAFNPTYPTPGYGSGFIVRLDRIGDERWGAFFGLPGDHPTAYTSLTSVAVWLDGSVYVGGQTTSNQLIGAAPLEPTPEFGFVSKLNPNGAGAIYTVRVGAWVTGVAVATLSNSIGPIHLPPTVKAGAGPYNVYDVYVSKLDEGIQSVPIGFN